MKVQPEHRNFGKIHASIFFAIKKQTGSQQTHSTCSFTSRSTCSLPSTCFTEFQATTREEDEHEAIRSNAGGEHELMKPIKHTFRTYYISRVYEVLIMKN